MLKGMTRLHAISSGISLEVAVHTDRGLERDDNQDTPFLALLPGAVVAAVCDGMGGAAGGQIASSQAAFAMEEHLTGATLATEEAAARALHGALEAATRRVFDLAKSTPRLSGMGTTATLMAVLGERVVLAQVGDSRAYLFRKGELTQLTRDQTLAQLMVERGQLAPEEVATFPHANVILQAVGTTESVEVDLRSVGLYQDDVLLVCSDGLHGPVDDGLLADVLSAVEDPAKACAALVDRALAAGGPDNVTCIVARVRGEGLAVAPSSDVDVTQCILGELPEPPVKEEAQVRDTPGKAPLSLLWPLRWGPWASKKAP
jgi:PPM family protein phosphatase